MPAGPDHNCSFGFCVMRVTSKFAFFVLRSVDHVDYIFRAGYAGCGAGAGPGGGADAFARGYSHASADGAAWGGSSLLLSAALGYVMGARNFRSSRRRGEIDLIGWDKDVLCFIEVKTRTTHDVKPAEAAVDRDKQRGLSAVADEYLRHVALSCRWRFDVVTVYHERRSSQPLIR
jgi:Holliday junction resolvase-like predicted endonuclease